MPNLESEADLLPQEEEEEEDQGAYMETCMDTVPDLPYNENLPSLSLD